MSRGTLPLIVALLSLPCAASAQDAVVQGRSVREWTQGLKNLDPRVRFYSLQALGEAGAESAFATPTLARLLKDPYPQLRREAAKLLAVLGAEATEAAPALALALGDADAGVRQSAAQALSGMGDKATTALAEALKSKELHARLGALGALEAMQPTPEIVKAVATAAKDGTAVTVRRAAVVVLAKFGSAEPEAQDALVAALRDKDLAIRHAAGSGLIALGKEAQPHFSKAFDDPNPAVRLTCLQGLSQLGDELDATTIILFAKALDDADPRVRSHAAGALGGVGPNAREMGGARIAEKLFERALKDKDVTVRRAALASLGKVGVDSIEELRRLAVGVKDADVIARGSAIHALSQYLHEETPGEWRGTLIGAIAEGLKDRDRRVQAAAAEVLLNQGAAAMGPLAKLAETGSGTPRMFAAYLLGEIGAPASAALPALEKMARESAPEARAIAAAGYRQDQVIRSTRRAESSMPPTPVLDPEEYIEQAYFFRMFRDRLGANQATQTILERIHEEILSTTRLPMAIQFLAAEIKHTGQLSSGFARLRHYFTAFQTLVISRTETERNRFSIEVGLEILEKEAQYRAGSPSREGLFVYCFETMSRNRLGYDEGLLALKEDAFFDEGWRSFFDLVRKLIGVHDFADLVFACSTTYVKEQQRQNPDYEPPRQPLFGDKEGKIARASLGRDPLYLFAALQRQLNYPVVPRAKASEDPAKQFASLAQRLQSMETRLKLIESEVRGKVDLSEFLARPPLNPAGDE